MIPEQVARIIKMTKIIDKIEERFNGGFKPSHGLMYPILRKLEESDLVKGQWEGDDPSKKTKRFYRITQKGRLALTEESDNFKPVIYETLMVINQIISDLYKQPV